MKKCLAVIACGLLAVLALAACGAKDDSSAQNTLEASLVALSGDLLTVQGTDGSELVFSVKGVEIENAEAYKAGDAVTITYTGEVKGTDTNRAVVVSVQNPAAESAQSAAQPEEKKLTGTLVDATMNAITLAVDKEEYVFATEGAEMKVLDGLVVGNTIEVTYTGELNGTDTSGLTVLCVTDLDDNASPAGAGAGIGAGAQPENEIGTGAGTGGIGNGVTVG